MTNEDYSMYKEALERSRNAREIDIRIMGDRNLLVNIVSLLGQIRSALNSGSPTDINVRIGHNIANGYFGFTVNDEQIDDLVPAKSVDIN